jgi:hypothetical protein
MANGATGGVRTTGAGAVGSGLLARARSTVLFGLRAGAGLRFALFGGAPVRNARAAAIACSVDDALGGGSARTRDASGAEALLLRFVGGPFEAGAGTVGAVGEGVWPLAWGLGSDGGGFAGLRLRSFVMPPSP